METLWSRRFSLASERTQSSAIRELSRLTENPEIISFAADSRRPRLFRSPSSARLPSASCPRMRRRHCSTGAPRGTCHCAK